MRWDDRKPLNRGTAERVTVNRLGEIVAAIAGRTFGPRHDLTKPQGVRGRNSDNTRLRKVLGWEPRITLEEGLRPTYAWIWQELDKHGRAVGSPQSAAPQHAVDPIAVF